MEGVGLWLPHCLRYVRSTYSSLIRLDLPGEALDIVAALIFDLRWVNLRKKVCVELVPEKENST
jgi:hypothetical protein